VTTPYDPEERHTAARIQRANPPWLILWGTYSRLYWAFPLFRTRPGTIISASTPQELTQRMRHAELHSRTPRWQQPSTQ
jgi:hypothetical protein